jgi:hypothetical protein
MWNLITNVSIDATGSDVMYPVVSEYTSRNIVSTLQMNCSKPMELIILQDQNIR